MMNYCRSGLRRSAVLTRAAQCQEGLGGSSRQRLVRFERLMDMPSSSSTLLRWWSSSAPRANEYQTNHRRHSNYNDDNSRNNKRRHFLRDNSNERSDRTTTTTTTGRNPNFVSLNKIMSQRGLCSRKEADLYLQRGWIKMNGQVLNKREHLFIDPTIIETLELTKEATRDQTNKSTILLHKPPGIVSGQPETPDQTPAVQLLTAERQFLGQANAANDNHNSDRDARNNINNKNRYHPRFQKGWATAGRLDLRSTGLLVLTQSGKIVNQIIHNKQNLNHNDGSSSTVEKEYLVTIPGRIHDLPQKMQQLREGVVDGDDVLRAVAVDQVYKTQLRIVLTSGKKHHIRRMFQQVGLPVKTLKRVRIGKVVLGNLPEGQWRYLGRNESFV